RCCSCHSSFCSSNTAPISRMMAASLGKMPTTSARRLTSLLSRSSGLVLCNLLRCCSGKSRWDRTSVSLSSMKAESFQHFCLRRSDVQPNDLASAIGVDRHSDYRSDRDDAAALALLQVGGVEPQIRPLAGERPVEEGMNTLIDFLAQLGNLRLADPGQSH